MADSVLAERYHSWRRGSNTIAGCFELTAFHLPYSAAIGDYIESKTCKKHPQSNC